jgi:hypothetical protein
MAGLFEGLNVNFQISARCAPGAADWSQRTGIG